MHITNRMNRKKGGKDCRQQAEAGRGVRERERSSMPGVLRSCLFLFAGVLCCLLGSACSKLPINGDLDGQWQVQHIEYRSGETETPKQTYYNFSLHTVNLMQVGGPFEAGNMQYSRDSLCISMPVSSLENLRPFGLNQKDTRFGVEKLTSSHLVLQSDYARLSFRKF